jgi:hypothetical protein
MSKAGGITRKGTKPNESSQPRKIGSGRNIPAKGFNPETKTWDTQSHGHHKQNVWNSETEKFELLEV